MENWQSHIPQTATPLLRRNWVQWLTFSLLFCLYLLLFHLPGQHTVPELYFPGHEADPASMHPAMVKLFQWMGQSLFWYKSLSLLILYLGALALFRLGLMLVKDLFWAISIAFLWLSSPSLVHHSVSFHPHVPALCAVLGGLFFFVEYDKGKRLGKLALSAGCLSIASILHPIASIAPLAILALLGWERGLGFRIRPRSVVFPHTGWKYLLGLGISLSAVALLCFPAPEAFNVIWNLSWNELQGTLYDFTSYWWHQMLPWPAWLALLGFTLLTFAAKQHLERGKKIFLLALGLFSLGYILYIFSGLRQMDALLLHLFPFLMMASLAGLEAARWRFPSIFAPRRVQPYKVLLGCLCLLSLYQSRQSLQQRQQLWATTEISRVGVKQVIEQ